MRDAFKDALWVAGAFGAGWLLILWPVLYKGGLQ